MNTQAEASNSDQTETIIVPIKANLFHTLNGYKKYPEESSNDQQNDTDKSFNNTLETLLRRVTPKDDFDHLHDMESNKSKLVTPIVNLKKNTINPAKFDIDPKISFNAVFKDALISRALEKDKNPNESNSNGSQEQLDNSNSQHYPNQHSKNKHESTSNPTNIKTLPADKNVLEENKTLTLDKHGKILVKVTERLKIIFEGLSDIEAEELTDLSKTYIDLPNNGRKELCIFLEELHKKSRSNIPVLPEKPSKEQIYQPAKGLRGDAFKEHLLGHLEKTWGQYLTYYNKELEVDVLYQDYLWEHDRLFMQKLYDKLYKMHKNDSSNPEPGDIIKTSTDRVSMEISNCSKEKIREYRRINSAAERRNR